MGFRGCQLVPDSSDRSNIILKDKTPVIIGRSQETKIKSKRCSRQQVRLAASFDSGTVEVLQIGPNPSEVAGTLLKCHSKAVLKEGDFISLLQGELGYIVHFESDDVGKNGDTRGKRLSEDQSMASAKRVHRDSGSDDDEEHLQDISRRLASLQKSVASSNSPQKVLNPGTSTPKKDPSMQIKDGWQEDRKHKLMIYQASGVKHQSKIAAFDMDNTLIATKSGKTFPMNTDDWRILYSDIPKKLQELFQQDYKLVIISNQKGLGKGRVSPDGFQKKVERIISRLGIPMQAYVCCGSGLYRKPAPGVWDYLCKYGNGDINIQISESVYVGDAAGRNANWMPGRKKDFSCSDRLFAKNVGLKFQTPEEFFLGKSGKVPFTLPSFDPGNVPDRPLGEVCASVGAYSERFLEAEDLISSEIEVVILVGSPASGKTHFAKKYLIPKGYVHVNRDTLGSYQKCISEAEKAIQANRKVVIDNTNPDVESRQRYIEVAKRLKVPCRCFILNCSVEQARHNNTFREIILKDIPHVSVTNVIINSYKSKYKEPGLGEGFSQILKINFKPTFENEEHERMYKMFLSDH